MVLLKQPKLFEDSLSKDSKEKITSSITSGTFSDNLSLPGHRWFRYTAGFSAKWVENVIIEKSPNTILDPFAGSGTTLLAAEANGVLAYGYESHPFISRIARTKVNWDQSIEKLLFYKNKIVKIASENTRPRIDCENDLLGRCYSSDALHQLTGLREGFKIFSDQIEPGLSELIWLAITSILRQCSFVGTAQCQLIQPKKRKSKIHLPLIAFEQKINEIIADISYFREMGFKSNATVFQHDAREFSDDVAPNSIDLVITSPPYPNNYDYADSTRLEMTFWEEINGWSDLQNKVRKYIVRSCSQHSAAEKLKLENLVSDSRIDSIRDILSPICQELAEIRITKGGKKTYHTMVAAYFVDLAKVFLSLRQVCKKGSLLCFVIGDSAPYGIYVPVDLLLGKLAVSQGFKSFWFEKIRDRNTKWKNRKHRVPLQEGRLWIEG